MKSCVYRGARTVRRGILSGAVATVAMSAVILAGRARLLLRPPATRQITEVEATEGGRRPAPVPVVCQAASRPMPLPPAFQAGWLSAHLLYGMGCGALFSLLVEYGLRRVRPGVPRHPVGLAFGLLVWSASYLGPVPALRPYPRTGLDTSGNVGTMIAAHVVFGASLAEVDYRLMGRDST